MRKYLLFVLLLCMHHVARGQTTFDYDYWFDNDRSTLHSGTSTTGAWQIEADLDELTCSFHTIHLQVKNSQGVLSSPVSRQFVKVAPSANQLTGHYWFDNDPTTMKTSDVIRGTFNVDVSMLREGYHTFHYQAIDNQGNASSVVSALIYKMVQKGDVKTFRCWFDNDYSTLQGNLPADDVAMLDVSQLPDGFHMVHVQADGITPTAAKSHYFIKQPQTMGVEYITLVCTIDNMLYKQEQVPNTGGAMLWNFDISDLKQGLHQIQVIGVTPSGAATSSYSTFFLRSATEQEISDMKLYYYVDNDNFTVFEGRYADGGFHFDLDVSQLSDGLHRLAYFMSNGAGITTKVTSQFFWKTPVGGNGITEYKYWLNDKSSENDVQVVQLSERTNPYKLISLLPVESQPIRSSCFDFRISDGQPTIYAKNDIHIRFTEATGRFSDVSKQFVDESVRQEVEPVGELQATQTFAKVAENDIRWYTMQVAPGDTAAFRLNQAATLQVFAPSGKEVFKTSESASVQWGGIHTWEDGTYYVAVHDVTGSQSNMTLDYMHMDKYDVVDWDVHTVGNGGCSTITFKGNGFRDLYRVDLYTAAGDSIHSVDISHDSDDETSVTFDFSGAELGVYNAVFHFTQEDKHFANIVTVEEAVDIELATNVTFPSTFLRGTSTTYTIKITNKGNMTAYCVPLELRLQISSMQDISEIRFSDNLEHFSIPQELLLDSIDEDVSTTLQEALRNYSDQVQFVFYTDSLENICYGLSQLFLNIRPNTTETFTITIKSSSTVDLDAKATDEWVPLTFRDMVYTKMNRVKRRSAGEWMCCNRTKIECVADVVANVAGSFMPPGANCVTSLSVTGLEAIYDILCSEGNTASEKFQNYLNSEGKSLARKILNSAISCVTGYFDKFIFGPLKAKQKTALDNHDLSAYLKIAQEINDAKKSLGNIISNLGKGVVYGFVGKDCVEAFKKPIPNCPPCTGCGGGGSSTPQPPADPNDIYGYLSDAGSKFMTDEVAKVNYTIEFENDTAFAQASAHTIVIRDTLDSRYFDLKSFLPTSVKIGEREAFLDEATDVKTSGSMTSFLKTIDMRPEINALAQVQGEYSQQTGIAKWTFTSLDPMTMEPTDDLMQGILPVNYNGTSGIGEVMFEVGVKPNKADGTQIPNRAGIVFDYEESILTPTWTNIVDATAPESHVADVKMLNDSTATVSIEATDELSGPWRYNVYVQYGSGAWFLGAENVPIDTTASVKVYEGINHGFYVVVTDSAGNVEQKNAEREFSFEVFAPQEDTDTQLALAEGWNWVSHNQNEALALDGLKPKAQRILSQTEELYKDARFGWSGDLEELSPTQMYKIQMAEADNIQLSGKLFNASFRSIPLYAGWNWLGYPVANAMTVAEALEKLEAEEGDFIIGQDGMATYSTDQWMGTLTELQPGKGYMYRSTSDKNLFYNATAQVSSHPVAKRAPAENWTVETRKYPNVMALVANLIQNGSLADANEWLVAAFCGDECRGVAQIVNGVLMMNIYGTGSEPISFYAMNRETEELMMATETENFRTDVLGSMQQPYELHIGETTGIKDTSKGLMMDGSDVYDLQGRQISGKLSSINARLKKGIYIVTDSKRTKTQKVVR